MFRLTSYQTSQKSINAWLRLAKVGAICLIVGALAVYGWLTRNSQITPIKQTSEVLAQSTDSDWPQLAHDVRRSGHNPQALTIQQRQLPIKWSRDLGVAMDDRIQPVVANGVLVIGDVNGLVYGINEQDGNTIWTYQTGAAILYTAAIDNGRVYIGSQDGQIYAFDLSTGQLIWQKTVAKGKGIGGSPLIYQGQLYLPGKDGNFYAWNANDGSQVWQFDTANANLPTYHTAILTTPSISPGKNLVFFAAENLMAYALDLNGNLRWSQPMYGESTANGWPMVSEANNLVIFRTKSVYAFHSSLALDENDLFCPGYGNGGCGGCTNLNADAFQAPASCSTVTPNCPTQWNEQHGANASIDWILNTYPQRNTFYAFNMDTGNQVPAPILWTGGGGRLGQMPVTNEQTGEIYLFTRTQWSRRDDNFFCRKFVDLVKLSFDQNQGTFHFLPCSSSDLSQTHCSAAWDFHFIGDETVTLSFGGDVAILTSWFHTGSLNIRTGQQLTISPMDGFDEGANGSGGDWAAPATIANKTIFVKQFARLSPDTELSLLVAYQAQ